MPNWWFSMASKGKDTNKDLINNKIEWKGSRNSNTVFENNNLKIKTKQKTHGEKSVVLFLVMNQCLSFFFIWESKQYKQ